MKHSNFESVSALFNEIGVNKYRLIPINSGRNSKSFKAITSDGSFFLKEYYKPIRGERDRLISEYNFLSYLNNAGVEDVPTVFAVDNKNHLGLYSYLYGDPLISSRIKTEHVFQSALFIESVNSHREAAMNSDLPWASEACLSIDEHIECVRERLRMLQNIDRSNESSIGLLQFIEQVLLPEFDGLVSRILDGTSDAQREKRLTFDEMIVSPSDFGFHNVLIDNKVLKYFDFEYAGWDDPSKLVCDFYCQPEYRISRKDMEMFCSYLGRNLCNSGLEQRSMLLMPLYVIKWCCIMLNEFLPSYTARRKHAGIESENQQDHQLNKSMNYLRERSKLYA